MVFLVPKCENISWPHKHVLGETNTEFCLGANMVDHIAVSVISMDKNKLD